MAEPLADTLTRLKRERDEADRRYNDALTALDRPLPSVDDIRNPPAPYDESRLAALNDAWNTIPGAPGGSGIKGRLAGFIWRTVAPYLQRQLTFNSTLVDYLNRNVAAAREAHRTTEQAADDLRRRFAAAAEFNSQLLLYLQQITAYVDTRDRETAGGHLVLNASLSGLAENVDKRWESLSVRDRRTVALTSNLAELRTMISVSQQASLALKRELERIGVQKVHETREARGLGSSGALGVQSAPFPKLDAFKYVAFEDQFRGSRDAIRARLESYLPFFEGASDVVDVGCGRGEFLELLAEGGIRARGIDLNLEMVEGCRARGLDAIHADAVGYLTSIPDASIGGVFAAQVVEHLDPAYLLEFLELASIKTRAGGRVVLETLNPACWVAFFDSFIRDITHVWPLHPDTLKYLMLASGFSRADIEYRSPVALQDRLQTLSLPDHADPKLAEIVDVFNANVERLNARMFTYLDYAVIGAR
jgi:SAM-dependent methyltransferase